MVIEVLAQIECRRIHVSPKGARLNAIVRTKSVGRRSRSLASTKRSMASESDFEGARIRRPVVAASQSWIASLR